MTCKVCISFICILFKCYFRIDCHSGCVTPQRCSGHFVTCGFGKSSKKISRWTLTYRHFHVLILFWNVKDMKCVRHNSNVSLLWPACSVYCIILDCMHFPFLDHFFFPRNFNSFTFCVIPSNVILHLLIGIKFWK